LSNLTELESLTLDGPIDDLPSKALAPFQQLQKLSLSGVNVTKGMENRAFDGMSQKIETLYLNNAKLNAIPKDIIDQFSVLLLHLNDNNIKELGDNDFSHFKNHTLLELELRNNPISRIGQNSLANLVLLGANGKKIDLANTNLESIDLAVFSSVNSGAEIILDNNVMLKSVTMSSDQFPKSPQIRLRNTGLETIDSKVGDMLTSNKFVTLDIENNVHLLCNKLAWMVCIKNVKYNDNTRCADKNNRTLRDYFTNDFCECELCATSGSQLTTTTSITSTASVVTSTTTASRTSSSTDSRTSSSTSGTSGAANQQFNWILIDVISIGLALLSNRK